MPVRTHRGRAAVYRKLWGWPLRSMAHLAVTGAVMAIAVTTIGLATDTIGEDELRTTRPGLAGARGYQLPTTSPYTITTRPSSPGAVAPGAAPERLTSSRRGPLAAAEAFTRNWARHPAGTTNAQWTEQLRPYATQEHLDQLASVDPASVPSSTVTGPAVVVDTSDSAIDIDVPTDALVLRLSLVDTTTGWRVTNYTQVRPARGAR